MDKFEYYAMCDCLNVFEAALLIVGEDPKDIRRLLKNPKLVKNQRDYNVMLDALKDAITYHTLPTRKLVSHKETGIDWEHTVIWRKELREWLLERQCTPKFFFPETSGPPGYLNPEHPRYAPKLAAAVHAWLAMEHCAEADGQSAKQSILNWLRTHAHEYEGLTDSQGKPVQQTIEYCARIVNWDPHGGAPRTPGN